MKRFILPALGLLLMGGAAFAQAERPPAPPAGVEDQMADQGPGPDAGPGAMADDAGGPPPPPPPGGPRGFGGHGGPGGPGGPGHGPGPDHRPPPPPPPPSKAAHFRIEKGDMRLDVKCAEDEPSRICSDTVLTLLDKLGAATPR